MKKKILILLVSMALLVGILSGCTEEETTPTPTNNAPTVTWDNDPVVTAGVDGGTVKFDITAADEDEDDTHTYTWDFGDGSEGSTDEDPEYTYAANGSYEVTVTVSDGTDEATLTTTVLVGNQAPVADYTYEITDLMVNFTDASTDDGDEALTYAWDFGDGNTSTEQSPEWTYEIAGTYDVTLTVTDMYGLTDTTDAMSFEVTEATE